MLNNYVCICSIFSTDQLYKNIIGIFEITIVYYNLCFGIEMDTLQWWNDELDKYTNKTDK